VGTIRLQRIDESILYEHSCLELTDYCYFLGEYASGQGFKFSEMNQVINNLKKPVDRKHLLEWRFKEQAIVKIAYWLMSLISWEKLKHYTWVTIPPSKAKSDPAYDDRLYRILGKVKELEQSLDLRDLLVRKTSRDAAHISGSKRLKVQELLTDLYVDESVTKPAPNAIAVFDDVITSGASFKAAQALLQQRYPNVPIIGIFVARNIKVQKSNK
jgi:hypothetical protein